APPHGRGAPSRRPEPLASVARPRPRANRGGPIVNHPQYRITDRREAFIRTPPKVELHLHIEGTLEPELLMTLAQRHGIELPYGDIEDVRAAYKFTDLQSFLDVYYQGAAALLDASDFKQLTWSYLSRMAA